MKTTPDGQPPSQCQSPPGRNTRGETCYTANLSENGGAGRDRTDDLKLAKLPLSQLSYGPICLKWTMRPIKQTVVRLGRLELPTSRLSGVRSNHLSYRRKKCGNHIAKAAMRRSRILICRGSLSLKDRRPYVERPDRDGRETETAKRRYMFAVTLRSGEC